MIWNIFIYQYTTYNKFTKLISSAVHKIDFQRSSQNNEIMSRMGRYQHTLYQHTLYHNKLLEYIHEPSSIKIAGSLIHVGSLHLCRLQRSLFSYTVSSTQLFNQAVSKAVYTSGSNISHRRINTCSLQDIISPASIIPPGPSRRRQVVCTQVHHSSRIHSSTQYAIIQITNGL